MKTKRLLYLIFPVITLILEILPYGAVCNFANPEGDPWRITYAYFALTPFGNANFAPFLTALATCVALLLLGIYVFAGKESFLPKARIAIAVAFVLSLCPLLFGVSYYSLVGGFITVSLVLELAVMWLFNSKIH